MIKFMYDGQEIEIPKIVPIGNNEYKIEEGSYSGEIFSMKNFDLKGDIVNFDCDSIPEIQDIITNYLRYILIQSIDKF